MDEKIINLNIDKKNNEKNIEKNISQKSFFHSNPILQQMFLLNLNNKKGKFKFKDLFR